MRLASAYKIRGSDRIEEVKAKGRVYQSGSFGIAVLDREDAEVSRFAFVVSTKISKLAVHRNKIIRSLNEGVRRNLYRMVKGKDFVFLAKRGIESKLTEDIIKEVDDFFVKFLK